jgi:hypothetical protein
VAGIALRFASMFSTTQMLAICSELGIDGEQLGLSDDSRRLGASISLIAELLAHERIRELFDICSQYQPGAFNTWWANLPPEEWSPRPLSERVVRKLNEALSIAGKPYLRCVAPTFESDWRPQYIETGCFCWPIGSTEIGYYASGQIGNEMLDKMRDLLTDEQVIVYRAADRQWTDMGMRYSPCIVVAQTDDQFDALRIEQTADGNYGIGTPDIIQELKKINEKHGVDIIAADEGSVEFRLGCLPEGDELARFNQWFQCFAPDAFFEGELTRERELTEPFRLWWD